MCDVRQAVGAALLRRTAIAIALSAALSHCGSDEDSEGRSSAGGSGGAGGAGASAATGGSGGTAGAGATGGSSGAGGTGGAATGGSSGGGGAVDCSEPGPTWHPTWIALETAVVERVNELRQAGGTCGMEAIAPVTAVAVDDALTLNARNHSQHMAETTLGFDGPDGSGPGEWGLRCFAGTTVAVNISMGHASGAAFVDALMTDEGTCKNVLTNATHVGVGYYSTTDPDADAGAGQDAGPDAAPPPAGGGFWTLLLAR